MKELWIKFKKWFDTGNHSILLCCSLLLLVGLMVCVFVGPYEIQRFNDPRLSQYLFLYKALPFAVIGWGIMLLIGGTTQKNTLITIAWTLAILSLLGLITIFVNPVMTVGTLRYAHVGNFIFMPSMVFLPAFIVLMSKLLEHQSDKNYSSKRKTMNLVISFVLMFCLFFVLFMMPDVFMAVIYTITYLVILGYSCLSTKRMNKICLFTVCGLIGLTLLLSLISNHVTPYTQLYYARLNVAQSHLISQNTQWLKILPDSLSNTSISAIFARFGIVFAMLVLGLYALITTKLIQISNTTKDKFKQLVLVGTIATLLTIVLIHLQQIYVGQFNGCDFIENPSHILLRICHGPTGFLPLSSFLPFVSFGGMNILVFCVIFGMCASLLKNNK